MDIEYIYPSPDRIRDERMAQPSASASGDAFSFFDLLDVVNPLQQLPVVGNLYRSATGDTISTGARLAGGFLLGGPVGFMIAAVNAGLEAATGADVAETMFAAVTGAPSEHQYASAAYKRTSNLS